MYSHTRLSRSDFEVLADEVQPILDELNRVSTSLAPAATKRLLTLVADLCELDRLRTNLRLHRAAAKTTPKVRWHYEDWPPVRFEDPELQTQNEYAARLATKINGSLLRYRWSPQLLTRISFEAAHWNQRHSRNEADWHEQFSVWYVLKLAVDGTVSRFRHCPQCGRWYYALAEHQRFCADACRKKYASTSDEYKRKRRIFMRKYRAQQKERNAAALRVARKATRHGKH